MDTTAQEQAPPKIRSYTASATKVAWTRRVVDCLGSKTVVCCLVDPYVRTVTAVEMDTVVYATWTPRGSRGSSSSSRGFECRILKTSKDHKQAFLGRELCKMLSGGSKKYYNKVVEDGTERRFGYEFICGIMWGDEDPAAPPSPASADALSQPGFFLGGGHSGVVHRGRALLYKNYSMPKLEEGHEDHPSVLRPLTPADIEVFWVEPRDERLHCVTCGAKTSGRCRGCLMARYCSLECQARDWEAHKPACHAAAFHKHVN